jgi:hypothetical protein
MVFSVLFPKLDEALEDFHHYISCHPNLSQKTLPSLSRPERNGSCA